MTDWFGNSKSESKSKAGNEYFASVFWKSKYKKSSEQGYQGTNYDKPYKTKAAARKAARSEIRRMKKSNPDSKHLKFSAHVATRKKSTSWF